MSESDELEPAQHAEVEQLAREGQALEAVKLFRAYTGASAEVALAAVEKMPPGAIPTRAAPAPDDLLRPVDEALARGNLIAAIKCYREATGASLRDAKDAVEARRDGMPMPNLSGRPASGATRPTPTLMFALMAMVIACGAGIALTMLFRP